MKKTIIVLLAMSSFCFAYQWITASDGESDDYFIVVVDQ